MDARSQKSQGSSKKSLFSSCQEEKCPRCGKAVSEFKGRDYLRNFKRHCLNCKAVKEKSPDDEKLKKFIEFIIKKVKANNKGEKDEESSTEEPSFSQSSSESKKESEEEIANIKLKLMGFEQFIEITKAQKKEKKKPKEGEDFNKQPLRPINIKNIMEEGYQRYMNGLFYIKPTNEEKHQHYRKVRDIIEKLAPEMLNDQDEKLKNPVRSKLINLIRRYYDEDFEEFECPYCGGYMTNMIRHLLRGCQKFRTFLIGVAEKEQKAVLRKLILKYRPNIKFLGEIIETWISPDPKDGKNLQSNIKMSLEIIYSSLKNVSIILKNMKRANKIKIKRSPEQEEYIRKYTKSSKNIIEEINKWAKNLEIKENEEIEEPKKEEDENYLKWVKEIEEKLKELKEKEPEEEKPKEKKVLLKKRFKETERSRKQKKKFAEFFGFKYEDSPIIEDEEANLEELSMKSYEPPIKKEYISIQKYKERIEIINEINNENRYTFWNYMKKNKDIYYYIKRIESLEFYAKNEEINEKEFWELHDSYKKAMYLIIREKRGEKERDYTKATRERIWNLQKILQRIQDYEFQVLEKAEKETKEAKEAVKMGIKKQDIIDKILDKKDKEFETSFEKYMKFRKRLDELLEKQEKENKEKEEEEIEEDEDDAIDVATELIDKYGDFLFNKNAEKIPENVEMSTEELKEELKNIRKKKELEKIKIKEIKYEKWELKPIEKEEIEEEEEELKELNKQINK